MGKASISPLPCSQDCGALCLRSWRLCPKLLPSRLFVLLGLRGLDGWLSRISVFGPLLEALQCVVPYEAVDGEGLPRTLLVSFSHWSSTLGTSLENQIKQQNTDLGDARPFEVQHTRLILEALDFSVGPAPVALAVLQAEVSACREQARNKRQVQGYRCHLLCDYTYPCGGGGHLGPCLVPSFPCVAALCPVEIVVALCGVVLLLCLPYWIWQQRECAICAFLSVEIQRYPHSLEKWKVAVTDVITLQQSAISY